MNTIYYKEQKMSWQYKLINDIFSKGNNQKNLLSDIIDSDLVNTKKTHCPFCLYKFYAPTIENVSDVQKQLLWLASPETFNDPYDCKLTYNNEDFMRYYTIKSFKDSKIFSDEEKFKIYRTNESGKHHYVHSFSSIFYELACNNPNIQKFHDKLFEYSWLLNKYIQDLTSNKYRIACFSSYEWDTQNFEQLMWAHYAQNHTGFCVRYDISPLFDTSIKDEELLPLYNTEKLHGYIHSHEQRRIIINGLFPVQYSSKRIELPKRTCYGIVQGSYNNIKQDVRIKILRSLITKLLPWKYEKEWRLIVDSEKAEKVDNKIPFPFAKEVIYGVKASEELKRILSDTAKILRIGIRKEYL